MSTNVGNQPVKLTKRVVDRATPPSGKMQAFLRDSVLSGFGLRITDRGTKSFIVEKRINGRVRRQTLGRYGELTVEQARLEAVKYLGKVAVGLDPAAEKKTAQARAVTLAQAFEDFKNARKNLKPKTLHDYTYHLEHYVSAWLNKPFTEITKQAVSRRHREIGEGGPKVQADAVFRTLKSVLNFARHNYEDGEGQSILPYNPVEVLNHTRAWYGAQPRLTVIKAHQLPAWFRAIQSLKAPDKPTSAHVIADFLLFVLFTGLRFNEAATLRWEQVDLADRTLTLGDPKNRQPFTLPLSDLAMALLEERRQLAVNECVFPDRYGKGHLVEPRRQMEHVIAQTGVKFSVHDLRRTYITLAESLGLSPYVLKRLINHKVSADVTDAYIVIDAERLRAPVQQIADLLKQLCGIGESSNAIALQAPATAPQERHG
jgi:integrase